MALSLEDRFWSKVHIDEHGCWEWQAGRHRQGYGEIYVDGKMMLAHRVAYWSTYGLLGFGEWPEWDVCHICDNPPCCRPDHLVGAEQALQAKIMGMAQLAEPEDVR